MNSPLTHFDLYGLATQRSGRELPESSANGNMRSQYSYGRMTCFLRNCVRLSGQVVESLGRDVIPIPLVREVTMGVGRALQLRPFFGCESMVIGLCDSRHEKHLTADRAGLVTFLV